MRLRYSLIAAILLLACTAAYAVEIPRAPRQYVTDLAGIIDDGVETKLDGYLKELEQKTTAQFLVLTVNSLDGEDIEGFSLQVAETWKLGQKGKDNGALLVVAFKDRKYRFDIGYGLEGILPDSLVGSIGRQYIVPYFRKGEYSNGVASAVLAVANIIARDSGVEITGMPRLGYDYGQGRRTAPGGTGPLGALVTILFFAGLAYLFVRHPRLLLLMLLFSGMGGRRGGWGGGGGFGGFGGGGGGGFGGGGASGGW